MAHEGQIIGSGEAGGAAAHDGHGFAGGRGAGRNGHVAGLVHRIALEAADVDGEIHQRAAAVGFAGVLTDEAAYGGEGIVLADETDGVGAAARAGQCDVTGDVHMSGTLIHAGDAAEIRGTIAVEGVRLVVIPEGVIAVQNHLGGLVANGAVRGLHDGMGGPEQSVQIFLGSAALQQGAQCGGHLLKADAAGDAFAAALG